MANKITSGDEILVVLIESSSVRHELVTVTPDGLVQANRQLGSWDCSTHLSDPNGVQLFHEIGRRARLSAERAGVQPKWTCLSMPGTVEADNHTLSKSTRLGIKSPIDVSRTLEQLGGFVSPLIFHDVECLALGEALHGAGRTGTPKEHDEDFAYVLVDEGVGSCIFINGKIYKGAGSACNIGRLVVEPDGAFEGMAAARGQLEVYASRPWLSVHIVEEYLTERDKEGALPPSTSAFRAAVAVAAETRWDTLSLVHIAHGVKSQDPIAATVLEEGARHLGLALSALVTIVNPPVIILAGGVLDALPTFTSRAVSYARRFSFGAAWNRVEVRNATMGRTAQPLGAAEMFVRRQEKLLPRS